MVKTVLGTRPSDHDATGGQLHPPGITRDVVITIARDLGFHGARGDSSPAEALYIADEVFFSGTAAEITPIRSVDKINVGSGRRGPITEAIQRRFFDIVSGREPDTRGWLTYVYPQDGRREPAVAAAKARS